MSAAGEGAMVCRIDLERWVHEELLKLRCDVDMRQAALEHEASQPPQLRRDPSLTSRRIQFKPLGLDLFTVYLCAPALPLAPCTPSTAPYSPARPRHLATCGRLALSGSK